MPKIERYGVGRTREGFGIFVSGKNDLMQFLDKYPDIVDDFMSTLVKRLAKRMVTTSGGGRKLSMKGRSNNYIPRDTGRLMAVFGGFQGKAQTGYIQDHARAKAKSPKSYDDDVIWEEIGKYTIIFGTTLFYAAIVQHRTDFMGTYLRAHSDDITDFVQDALDVELKRVGKIYGFD